MRDYQRCDRLAELIQVEVAMLLQRHIADPRLKAISITDVKVTPDLGHARIYFSLLTPEAATIKAATLAFRKASGFIRKHIASSIELRIVPTLAFFYDDLSEKRMHLAGIIERVARDL